MPTARFRRESPKESLELARVLLVDDDVASRLTLQTVLEAGGYSVEVAATAAEAVVKLDAGEYQLVLTDLRMESPEAGLKVIRHAKLQPYKPATAVVTAYPDHELPSMGFQRDVFVETEDVPTLLTKVADMIGTRATRRVERALRQAAS
ncbi:MAG: response regulator [Bryobacteraceae bacterium]